MSSPLLPSILWKESSTHKKGVHLTWYTLQRVVERYFFQDMHLSSIHLTTKEEEEEVHPGETREGGRHVISVEQREEIGFRKRDEKRNADIVLFDSRSSRGNNNNNDGDMDEMGVAKH